VPPITFDPSCKIDHYELEIRDESGSVVKTEIGDRKSNTVIAVYPDGRKEFLHAFE
jgi:hypothetical protein